MKKTGNLLILLFFIYITLQVLINSNEVIESVYTSIEIFKNRVFPTLFPFFILSEILINYRLIEYISIVLNKFMYCFFKINGACAFIFMLSMITGFPSSAKFTKDLYDNNYIDELSATKILMFSHFSNPLFILGFIGTILNVKVAIYILIIHYLTNIIIGLFVRNYFISNKKSTLPVTNIKPFGIVLKDSIKKSIDTLLVILGTITFFIIITTIINKLNINPSIKFFINCFLEMTNGINYITNSLLPLKSKCILITMVLSFGGLSVHFQILSIIGGTKIKYQPYLIARLFHAFISGMLVFISFNLLNI